MGWGKVLALKPCPPIQPGPGQVVTATFKHEPDDNVLDVRVEGLAEPIGVTDTHPFWSEDRQAFVAVGKLRSRGAGADGSPGCGGGHVDRASAARGVGVQPGGQRRARLRGVSTRRACA